MFVVVCSHVLLLAFVGCVHLSIVCLLRVCVCVLVVVVLTGLSSWLIFLIILNVSKKCVFFWTFWGPPGAGSGPKMCPRGPALEPQSIV